METTFKKHKLVVLPTHNKINSNCLTKIGHILSFQTGLITNVDNVQTFHLYILSDEEIKVGNWCISDLARKTPYECKNLEYAKQYNCKKIIATTDSSLKVKEFTGVVDESNQTKEYCNKNLPQIPRLFIEHFVSKYNQGNVVREIGVEYEWEDGDGIPGVGNWYILKTNENNEINIKTTKSQYTIEEVESLLKKLADDIDEGYRMYTRLNTIGFDMIHVNKNWMNNNL